MKLDKNKGKWFDYDRTGSFWINHQPRIVDDYAYHLYLNDINPILSGNYKVDQNMVMYDFIMHNKFKKYYFLAEQKLRKEKIDKIIARTK